MEQKGTNIQVAIRIKPFISLEMKTKLRPQWDTQDNIIYQIDEYGQKFGEFYSFDHIFGTDKTNRQIYNDIVKDFALSSLDGLNTTIFAYGQTSSGKTYTMLGNKNDTGIMSRAIDNIFDIVENDSTRKFLIRVSYIEIYNEKINDLLDVGNKDVKIREFCSGAIGLQNVKEEMVSSRDQVHQYLKIGNLNRHIGSTKINDRSSRSHTIFRIMIESTRTCDIDGSSSTPVQVSNLNLVDLAGSERVAQTKATGVRLKEGGHINKSLSALGLVIKQLSDGQEFVNFRDSKLTRLLQDSLGGNSKTLIIATITLTSVEDTSSTLAFAQRAKTVRNKPQVNTMLTDGDLGKRYAALNVMLNEELHKNQELERTREENSREISRLKQQMEMLENFLYGNKNVNLNSQPIPKRRHTIGFTAQKQLFSKISMEVFEECGDSADNISLLEDPTKESLICASTLEPIAEEDNTPLKEVSSLEECSRNLTFRRGVSNLSTPETCLRVRLSALEQEYNELLTFTRYEEKISSEASREVENLEERLEAAQNKILELEQKLAEHNRCTQISELEEKLRNKEDVIVDCQHLKDRLVYLQEVLSSSNFTNEIEVKEENSVLSIIERFNIKVKTSKDIIENEILKQINIFEHGLSKQINRTNELASFNDLLNELSSFESDLPVDLISNMKQNTVEEFKTLIQIYESILTKNALIQKCSEKIKMLEDSNIIQNETFINELNSIKIHASTLQEQLQEKIDTILYLQKETQELNKEKENLVVEVEEAKRVIEEYTSTINNYKSKIVSMENDCAQLSRENEQLKTKLTNVYSENRELTNCVTKFNLEITEKNKKIEKITEESSKNLLENQSLKSDIKSLNSKLEQTQSNIEQLSVEIREKDDAICHSKFENNVLKTRVESLNQNLQNILFENEELKKQMTALQNYNSSYIKKVNLLQDEVSKLVAKIEFPASDKIEIVDSEDDLRDKQNKLSPKKKIDMVTAEIVKKVKIIEECSNINKTVTQEVNSLNQQIRKMLLENENLKQQIQDMTNLEYLQNDKITSLQDQISKLTKEIMLKSESLLEYESANCVLKQDTVTLKNQFSIILSENELLKHEILDLKKYIEKSSFELSEKNKTISRIKESETDTNNLKCKVKQYESELLSCNEKISEYTQLIQSLQVAKNELENKIIQDCYKNASQEEKCQTLLVSIDELNSVKENLQSVVCSIIEQFINEQKSLLTMRLSQEQREEFKIILKDLKCNILLLKQKLNFLQSGKEYDYNEIKDNLVKAQCNLKEYFSMDKFFMQKQINILESTNKEYLQEIIALKDLQQSNNDCRYCETLKAELLGLKKQQISQDEILNSLKTQNKLLGKENRSRMEQVVNLQMQIYNEQDKKAEPKHSELLRLYDENKKMQHREIQTLQQQIEKMKNFQLKNRKSIQIQCSLLKEEAPMLLKDKLTNNIYLPKTQYENKLEEHQTHANINKQNIDVQCTIMDWEKYNLTKKLCQLRKSEIESMKLKLEKFKSFTTNDKVVYKPDGVQCNIVD